MAHEKVYAFCESGCKVEVTPKNTVTEGGKLPVTGGAVAEYAMKKDAATNTVTADGTAPVTGKAVAAYFEKNKQAGITISNVDLTPGVSELASGEVYLVYE